jgi:hypothetical protein
MPSAHSKRSGEYVYELTVTKDESVRLTQRYRAYPPGTNADG